MNEKAIEILNWLKGQGYSIPTVCEGSKISKTYYYNIIRNEKNISREVFDRIEEFAKLKGFDASEKPIVNQKCNDEQVLKNTKNIKAIYKMVKALKEENKKLKEELEQIKNKDIKVEDVTDEIKDKIRLEKLSEEMTSKVQKQFEKDFNKVLGKPIQEDYVECEYTTIDEDILDELENDGEEHFLDKQSKERKEKVGSKKITS